MYAIRSYYVSLFFMGAVDHVAVGETAVFGGVELGGIFRGIKCTGQGVVDGHTVGPCRDTGVIGALGAPFDLEAVDKPRITSYNVCYTKLLRDLRVPSNGERPRSSYP